MEVNAITKSVKVSPRKVRLIADSIRNISATKALDILSLTRKRGSLPIKKTLLSAIANAVNNKKLNKDSLHIKKVEISEGPAFKRFHPSTRGRIHPYKKRTSNIEIILEEKLATIEKTEPKTMKTLKKTTERSKSSV